MPRAASPLYQEPSMTQHDDTTAIQAALEQSIAAFNSHDVATYFAGFVDDNTEFPYVVSPLRHDAAMWKAFIEGTGTLDYVNYHQQDTQIQVYNGDSAVVTGYYSFTWKEKGATMNYQSGRASMFLVKKGSQWKTAHMHFSEMF
jgi:ketosteroid isomerase-like protein